MSNITKAAHATDQIQDHVGVAMAIEAALSIMRSTDWPSNAEYDALDQGSDEAVSSP